MPRTPLSVAVLAAGVLLLGACAPSDSPVAAEPAPAPDVDPPRAQGAADPPGPVETTVSIPVGAAGDGTPLAVVARWVAVGDRRLVAIDTPDGRVDQHVVTADDHWWWIPPLAQEAVDGIEWIHVDVAQVEASGERLPDLVADARLPPPEPGEVEVGTVVAGKQVVAVERVGADEDLLTLAGFEEPARLRRRRLPPGAVVDIPAPVVELADLPGLLPHLGR